MKEQIFFNNPAIDKLLEMVMALAAEVYSLRDRTQTMESLLAQHGLSAREPDVAAKLKSAQHLGERDAFIARLLEPWLSDSSDAKPTINGYRHDV